MKLILFIFIFFISLSIFADAGLGYRFHLQLVSRNSDTLNGYFYFYADTENSYERHLYNDEGFKDYVHSKSIKLYSYITTISIGNKNVDFTTQNYEMTVSLDDFDRIRVSEFLNFGPVDRLYKLTQFEFNLIQLNPPKYTELYNENVAENCSYILLTWDQKSDTTNHAVEINKRLEIFGEDVNKNQFVFYEYLDLKKEELLRDSILIINYCVPL